MPFEIYIINVVVIFLMFVRCPFHAFFQKDIRIFEIVKDSKIFRLDVIRPFMEVFILCRYPCPFFISGSFFVAAFPLWDDLRCLWCFGFVSYGLWLWCLLSWSEGSILRLDVDGRGYDMWCSREDGTECKDFRAVFFSLSSFFLKTRHFLNFLCWDWSI